ncbi:hypothetical protein Tco_0288968, partial [Tanacetum coccineum]
MAKGATLEFLPGTSQIRNSLRLVLILPRQRHVDATWMTRGCHVDDMWLPHGCHVDDTWHVGMRFRLTCQYEVR